ncbi:MAG TPA: glycoside hydrolase family 5 protein [Fibrobacteria bacterium]|nr:glycoside hydrolase family 5 protein [Fibrobacteria bacterium]
MKRATAISLGLAALLGANAHSATIVETHGAMRVAGNQIVNKDSIPFQVAGMSFFWSAWMSKYWNTDVVNTLVTDWNCGLVRAAMGIEGTGMYLLAPAANKAMVKTVVDAAIAKGVYVIIDWHDHSANLHVDEAKAFFDEMAQLYKNTPNVIWEIWNEPDNKDGTGTNGRDDWAKDIKPYAEQIIPVIRKHSQNLIVVGTPTWSQDVDIAARDPITSYDNIAYTLHFYAGTHGDALIRKANAARAAGVALFITEWGTSVANGGTTGTPPVNDNKVWEVYSDVWLDWAKQAKISWANWSLADKDESSAALKPGAPGNGNWTDANLSKSGLYVRRKIREVATYEFTGVAPRRTTLTGFSARSIAGDLRVSLPAQASELLVRDLNGRTLARHVLSGEKELNLQAPQEGVVLVQVVAASGTQAIPVAVAR